MIFDELVVDNFMSIKHASTNFNKKGLVLIEGDNKDADAFKSNGSGKSTLFSEAPTWVLYGETIRGQKADKVVNRSVGKNTRVSQKIVDDNGDVYEIIRHRKHSEHSNHVLFYRNNDNITGKSDADTNKMIEDLIEMDFSTFTNSIMFGQGVSKMFALSTDGEQKKILERMLQIDIYLACQERAKKYLETTTSSISKANMKLDASKKEKASLTNAIEELQTKEAELGRKIAARVEELTDELNGYNKEMDNLPDISAIDKEKEKYENLREKLNSKLTGFKEHEDTRDTLVGDKRSLQRDIVTLTKQLSGREHELHDIQANKNVPRTCETCGQGLSSEDTTHVENHVKEAIEKLSKEREEKTNELVKTEELLNKVMTLLEGKKKLEQSKDDLQAIITDMNVECRLAVSRVREIDSNIDRIGRQLKEQENLAGTTYTDLIQSNIDKSKYVDEVMDAIQDELSLLDKDHEHYAFWVNSFGNQGIKSVLLDSVTPFLNQRANHYLADLSDSSIGVLFNTQTTLKTTGEKRDKFSVDITNENGDDDYKGNSNGEKRRIDIAINMALQDLVSSRSNKRVDLIVYDEVFEGLDSVGAETVIGLLQEKAKVFGTVMVITHNDHLKQLFNNSLTVSKEDGRTEVM